MVKFETFFYNMVLEYVKITKRWIKSAIIVWYKLYTRKGRKLNKGLLRWDPCQLEFQFDILHVDVDDGACLASIIQLKRFNLTASITYICGWVRWRSRFRRTNEGVLASSLASAKISWRASKGQVSRNFTLPCLMNSNEALCCISISPFSQSNE